MTLAKTHRDNQKEDFRNQTDNAAARVSHYQRHSHQPRDEKINESLFLLDCSGEDESERQRQSQFHVAGKMMPVDEGTKRLGLRQLA